MKDIDFIDKYGTFRIKNPENYSGLYLPLAGEKGLKSSITPTLGGDSKTSQNTFLLEPVSIENLHNNKGTRILVSDCWEGLLVSMRIICTAGGRQIYR